MKKVCIIFLLSIIISLTAVVAFVFPEKDAPMSAMKETQSAYLRIHIRADSNENDAQAVKYCVRDEVVEYLTPIVAECPTKESAMDAVEERLQGISAVAEGVLLAQGYTYGATAQIKKEQFPTRIYEGHTLPAGEYSALIIRLGRGEGDNWWCVIYPPLCFAATSEDVVYKSKIKEIIDRFYENART